MRILVGVIVCLLAVVCAGDRAFAHPRGPSAPYTVTAEDASGRELRTFHHRGQTFVLGSFGERYNIRVQNRTGRRVEAVVSVDGRDVITGAIGDYKQGRGYIIAPYDDVLIEGFRTSLEQVAAFRFTNPSDSYSARMGTPQHVGIIGVAIFPERAYRPPPPIARPEPAPLYRRHRSERSSSGSSGEDLHHGLSSGRSRSPRAEAKKSSPRASGLGSSAAPQMEADASSEMAAGRERTAQNLGTQYGEARHSHVQEVQFRRAHASRPSSLITLRYDNREGLLARGIQLYPRHPITRREPDAFPNSRFAPPPPY